MLFCRGLLIVINIDPAIKGFGLPMLVRGTFDTEMLLAFAFYLANDFGRPGNDD